MLRSEQGPSNGQAIGRRQRLHRIGRNVQDFQGFGCRLKTKEVLQSMESIEIVSNVSSTKVRSGKLVILMQKI